jgi:hypothetical protein
VESHVTTDTVRAIVPEEKLDAAIDALRQSRARLIAVTPVRATLEDYFVAKLADRTEVAP